MAFVSAISKVSPFVNQPLVRQPCFCGPACLFVCLSARYFDQPRDFEKKNIHIRLGGEIDCYLGYVLDDPGDVEKQTGTVLHLSCRAARRE